jgi:8-hydroxy-5-deazaflavin:NADPH oxidoreductase
MKIGILGAGRIGAVAARLFVAAGHEVAISNSRGPESLRELAEELGSGAHATDIGGAAAFGEIVLLAVPWHRADALPATALLRDKVVIDAMNPYRPEGGFYDLGQSTSSEEVLKRIPGVRLVKAFNTIYYEHLAGRGRKDLPIEERHAVYVASDDPAAKAVVERLIEEIGFAPVDTGSLREGGRLQQPDSPIYNQTFTAREARVFFRNELHKLADVIPDAALPRALESLGKYKAWPPPQPQQPQGLEQLRKRAEQVMRQNLEAMRQRTRKGAVGGYSAAGSIDRQGSGGYSSSTWEGDTFITFSVRSYRGIQMEVVQRLRFSDNKKRLVYIQEIKGPKGDEIRHEDEFAID